MTMHHFHSWDDTEIAYREWGAGDSTAPPVVLHHGFAADMAVNWVAPGIVAALRAAGRHVVALDARGHGGSQKPHDPARYGEQAMARDLARLVEQIGAEQIDLVGYSMGAIVALLFSAEDQQVRRLVLGGIGSGVIECGGVDRRTVSQESIIAALSAADPTCAQPREARAVRELADAIGADREALLAHARSVYRGAIALERVTAPTLVIAGEQDPMALRPQVLADALAHATVRLVPGDHATAVIAPQFASTIVGFLGDG